MRGALLALLPIALASGAEARFRPRTDVPYQLVSTATNTRDGVANRFALTRRIRFARAPHGLTATVTIAPADIAGDAAAGTIFDRAFAALGASPIVVLLDRDGKVTDVADADALWQRLLAGLGSDSRGERARAMLGELPAARRAQVLAEAVAGLAGSAEAERHDGERATTLPVGAYTGAGTVNLPARETVRTVGGRVTIEQVASGDAGGGRLTDVTRRQVVERATGLVLEARQDLRMHLRIDGTPHDVETLTMHTLSPLVSQYLPGKPRKH